MLSLPAQTNYLVKNLRPCTPGYSPFWMVAGVSVLSQMPSDFQNRTACIIPSTDEPSTTESVVAWRFIPHPWRKKSSARCGFFSRLLIGHSVQKLRYLASTFRHRTAATTGSCLAIPFQYLLQSSIQMVSPIADNPEKQIPKIVALFASENFQSGSKQSYPDFLIHLPLTYGYHAPYP